MKSNTIIFSILCLIWGMTWIGIKAGIAVVPPLMFAGTRFAVAGILILGIACLRGKLPRVARRDWPRLLLVTLLMIPLCYGPLFWGMLYIDSGTAAVLELSLTPVALLVFALLLGDERYDGGRLFAILLGVIGLCILFAPEVYSGWAAPNSHSTSLDVLGSVAVAAAAIIYAWGSVMARPLLAIYSSDFVAGSTTVLGGTALVLASLAFEPGSSAALAGNWGWPAWAGWAFLVLFGSVVGYTLFMRLLRDIGASRAGAFAFVSPVVAVLLGIVVYGEGFIEMIGMAVMLSAAFLALRGPKDSKSPQALSVITAHSRDWL